MAQNIWLSHTLSARGRFELSVRDWLPRVKEDSMKKTKWNDSDDLRPEYDFALMKNGVRGKYAQSFRSGSNVVLLPADIAEAFPTEEAVNEALRGILKIARTVRKQGRSRAGKISGRSKRASRS